MWFLNKTTGVKWHVTDKELQDRLTKNNDYDVVKEESKTTVESKEKPAKKGA